MTLFMSKLDYLDRPVMKNSSNKSLIIRQKLLKVANYSYDIKY